MRGVHVRRHAGIATGIYQPCELDREAIAGMGITAVPLTAPIAERAAELRARHDASRLPDAIVLATAHEHEGSLITYDERLARRSSAPDTLTPRGRTDARADRPSATSRGVRSGHE